MSFSLLWLTIIFFSSLLLTMVGLGGGLIFSPLFVLLGFPKTAAVSTSLFLNGVAAASAATVYLRQKMVDFSVSIPLIIASAASAPLGALTTHHLRLDTFVIIMAGVVFLAGLRMIVSAEGQGLAAAPGRRRRILGGGVIGLAIGFMGGLLGIGGGVFVVPLLIYFLGVPTKTAAATSIFIICFSSFSGFAAHASMIALNWRFVLLAALVVFAAGQIGSRIMAQKLKSRTIRVIFGLVLFFMSAKLIHQALF